MERELDASEEDVVNVRASLLCGTSAESFIAKSENIGLLTGECLMDCTRAMFDGLYVAPASRCQSSDASEAIPDVREDEHCGSNTHLAISLEDTPSSLLYKLPNGTTANLKGCRQMMHDGADMIIGPQGDEYTSMQYAYEALQWSSKGPLAAGAPRSKP